MKVLTFYTTIQLGSVQTRSKRKNAIFKWDWPEPRDVNKSSGNIRLRLGSGKMIEFFWAAWPKKLDSTRALLGLSKTSWVGSVFFN